MYTIGVFDDEMWIRELIKSLIPFEELNLKLIREAENGGTALELCREDMPDIILTDIRMPGLTGLQLISAIREESAETEIIIISGYDDFEYARQAIKYRVDEYLLKPVEEEEITRALKNSIAIIRRRAVEKKELRSLKRNVRRLCLEKGQGDTAPPPSVGDPRIRKALEIMHSCYQDPLTMESLAEETAMNPTYFSEVFKRETGKGFARYLTDLRMKRARQLLEESPHLRVLDVARSCGYGDPNYFSRLFRRHNGESVSAYRERLSENCPD